jgi:hypothetical protein
MARTPESASAALSAAMRSSSSSGMIAFSRCGRLSVTMRTPSPASSPSTVPLIVDPF